MTRVPFKRQINPSKAFVNAPLFGVKTEFVNEVEKALEFFDVREREAVQTMAEAVKDTAYDSMKPGGSEENRTKKGIDLGRKRRRGEELSVEDEEHKKWYEAAPHGEPPHYHTQDFRNAMDIFGDPKGKLKIVGFPDEGDDIKTNMAMRARWFEFGGRPSEMGSAGGKYAKPRKRKYGWHAFLGPALQKTVGDDGKGFAYILAGTMNR